MTSQTIHVQPGDQITIIADQPVVTSPPVTPPPTGTSVPIGQLPTAIAGATAGQVLLPVAGKHVNTSMMILRPTGAQVVGTTGTIIAPKGKPNGISLYGDNERLASLEVDGDTTNTSHDSSGAGLVNINGRPANNSTAPVTGVVIEDVIVRMSPTADSSEQGIYLSGGVSQATIRRTKIYTAGAGFGLHFYHDDGLTSDGLLIEDVDIYLGGTAAGVILWWNSFGGKLLNATFRRVVWHGAAGHSIARLSTGGTITFEDCKGPATPTNEGSTFKYAGTNDWGFVG